MALINGIYSNALRKFILPRCTSLMSTSAHRNAEKQPSYDNNKLILRDFRSRNPRNLELLRIAFKPEGYALDKPGRCFYNKLVISSNRHSVKGEIIHNSGVVVVSASSAEWGIKKQLYRFSDFCAFKAVGAVLASRAQECGIYEVYSGYTAVEGTKVELFLKTFEAGGVALEEKDRYRRPDIFEKIQQTPPWEDLNIM